MAPEQAQGEHLDARADQYSLAALTFLMLTGRPPYSHSSLSPRPPPRRRRRRCRRRSDRSPRRSTTSYAAGSRADRDDRFPDVPAYVAALREALGRVRGRGSLPRRWLPVDPELTQPGNKPSLVPVRRRPARAGPAEAARLVAGRRCWRWC